MILGESVLRRLIPGLDPDQYQPAGVDLRLGKVLEPVGKAALLEGDDKRLPGYREVEPEDGVYELSPGKAYVWELEPAVKIPKGKAAVFLPRSTLLRSAVSVHTALGDPGFEGKIRVLAVNHGRYPYRVAEGERVVQMVLLDVKGSGVYEGDYGR